MAPKSGPLQLYYAKAATVRDGRTVNGRYDTGGIDSWPADVQLDLPKANTVIEAAYTGPRPVTGLRLFEVQAIRQNELFLKAFE